MSRAPRSRYSFRAGHLALDFVNTLAWRASPAPEERLRGYGDLLRWCGAAGLLEAQRLAALRRHAARARRKAEAALRRAVKLRELICRLCLAVVRREPPARRDLDSLNQSLAIAAGRAELRWGAGGFAWTASGSGAELESLLDPLVRSTAELLSSGERSRIGQCRDARGCGWLFLDRSRSRVRQWCSMAECGNRAKALRHYRRARATYARSSRALRHRRGAASPERAGGR